MRHPADYFDALYVFLIPVTCLVLSFLAIILCWSDTSKAPKPKQLWTLFILSTVPVGLGAALYLTARVRRRNLRPLMKAVAALILAYDVSLAVAPSGFLWRKQFLELSVLANDMPTRPDRRDAMLVDLQTMRAEALSGSLSAGQAEHYRRMLVYCLLALAHGLDERDFAIWRELFLDRHDPAAFQQFLDDIMRDRPPQDQNRAPMKSAQPVPEVSSVNLYTSLFRYSPPLTQEL